MHKAIKIDVEKKAIYYVDYKTYTDIYTHIGNGCQLFCVPVQFPNGDSLFADDESLLRPADIVGGFIMTDWSYPIVGNAIILGTDDEGESISPVSDIELLSEQIIFIDKTQAIEHAERVMNTPPKISFL